MVAKPVCTPLYQAPDGVEAVYEARDGSVVQVLSHWQDCNECNLMLERRAARSRYLASNPRYTKRLLNLVRLRYMTSTGHETKVRHSQDI